MTTAHPNIQALIRRTMDRFKHVRAFLARAEAADPVPFPSDLKDRIDDLVGHIPFDPDDEIEGDVALSGRPMTSLWASLTPEQQARVRSYDGPINHGSEEFKR